MTDNSARGRQGISKRTAYVRMAWGVGVALLGVIPAAAFDSQGIFYLFGYAGIGLIAFGISNLAEAKGHRGGIYFLISLFFCAPVGLVVVWLLPDRTRATETPKGASSTGAHSNAEPVESDGMRCPGTQVISQEDGLGSTSANLKQGTRNHYASSLPLGLLAKSEPTRSSSPCDTGGRDATPAGPPPLLNRRQRIVLWCGISVFAIMGLVPPWTATRPWEGAYLRQNAGYSLIVLPPAKRFSSGGWAVQVDLIRLGVQWTIVSVVTAGVLLTSRTRNVRHVA